MKFDVVFLTGAVLAAGCGGDGATTKARAPKQDAPGVPVATPDEQKNSPAYKNVGRVDAKAAAKPTDK